MTDLRTDSVLVHLTVLAISRTIADLAFRLICDVTNKIRFSPDETVGRAWDIFTLASVDLWTALVGVAIVEGSKIRKKKYVDLTLYKYSDECGSLLSHMFLSSYAKT